MQELLPGLAEDARVVLERIRRETHFVDAASNDVLTGLPNRRVAMRVLGRLHDGDSVAMIDLDHFKEVNDTLGHGAGDEVLRGFARALRMAIRASDTAGRIGGEEFLLLLPAASPDDALAVLDRLRLVWAEIRPSPITFSAGVATVTDGAQREALTRADEALYAAKNSGRDRFEVAP
ncbi:MAG: GGDEF domain-containing protein [Ilumatobacteraceae bacterium]